MPDCLDRRPGRERSKRRNVPVHQLLLQKLLLHPLHEPRAAEHSGANHPVERALDLSAQRRFNEPPAVSAAKAALESHIRQLALELAPLGITVNAIQAGLADTSTLRKIPGNEEMLKLAQSRNPVGRLTRPEDVAEAIAVFAEPGDVQGTSLSH
ncbi:MAG: SDR family oxidoreductase [Deltaproteobacteria bacterium]|nr:SDR family oxidoreductase [Deltaproteobacteria bacterium]